MRWQPDPTFYPSPKMAMEAPAEKLAYVAMLNPTAKGTDAHDVEQRLMRVDPGIEGVRPDGGARGYASRGRRTASLRLECL